MRTAIKILLLLLCASMCEAQMIPMPIGTGSGPINTYWTFNSSYIGSGVTLSNGNLTITTTATNTGAIATLPGGTTGKSGADYYFEVTVTSLGNNTSVGLVNTLSNNMNTWLGNTANSYAYYSNGASGGTWLAGTLTFGPPPDVYQSGDVVGILFKGSTNQMVAYRLRGTATTLEFTTTIPSGSYWPAVSGNGSTATVNFGQSAWQVGGAPFTGTAWKN